MGIKITHRDTEEEPSGIFQTGGKYIGGHVIYHLIIWKISLEHKNEVFHTGVSP